MKVGLIVAMESEFKALTAALENAVVISDNMVEGSLGVNEIVLMRSGIGKVNAALRASELIRDHRPDCIISSGCAGGLAPHVHVMSVVVAAKTAYHDVWCGQPNEYGQVQGFPLFFEASQSLLKASEGKEGIHVGLICTGDQFLEAGEAAGKVLNNFPDALAVDMESAAIAQTCHLSGIPFMSMRVISDSVADSDREQAYNDFWKNVSERSTATLKAVLESLPSSI